jgi:hypothetical protein
MRIRRIRVDRAKSVGYTAAKLYTEDLEYIDAHGIERARALRDSLHEYVLTMRGRPAIPALPVAAVAEIRQLGSPVPDMTDWTKKERDAWILEGAIPARAMRAEAGAPVGLRETATESRGQ